MKYFFVLTFLSFNLIHGQNKINGLSFVASNREISEEAILPVININANWVTLMPFAFMKNIADTTIVYNNKRQWWGERKEGIAQTAAAFHEKKIKIMLKPQIWIPNGFTGHIEMKSESEWIALEKNYETFILDYAKLAQKTNCEIFCIGTELNNFVVERPRFWKKLIVKIRKLYLGKITYAENWDTYQKVPFLSDLDYIGIDAYFPLSKEKTPSIKILAKAWKPIKEEIKFLSKKLNKKVLFTEFGYQSKDFTTEKPWEHHNKMNVNLKAQENALAIILAVFWKENWFEGGFLWKWYDNHQDIGGLNDTDYTIQNKPVEKIIAKFYK
ncbi:glycoside hydrolase family 113 [Flavobacterium sp.]|uniref:glycoside hydrolase family 113 n=1 Tax=Flavobacterium sp. TaxID=239 RepID=UPI003753A6CB